MFGRRDLLLLLVGIGAVSALVWIAQASSPLDTDASAVVHASGTQDHSPVWAAAGDSDHVPMVPRLVSLPVDSAPPLFVAGRRYRQCGFAAASSILSRTLQQQRVLWQV